MYTEEDKKLARQLLSHSVELKPGEKIMIQCIGLNAIGLVRALAKQVRELAAHPFLKIEDPETNRMLLESGDEEFWTLQTETDQLPLMKQMDAFIGIRASENIYENTDVSQKANKAYSDFFLHPVHFEERVNHTNWAVLRYPSPAFAMNAKMSTERFREFYYKACLFDYNLLEEAMKPLEERTEENRHDSSARRRNEYPVFGKRPELDSLLW